jgi:hypothetical protein
LPLHHQRVDLLTGRIRVRAHAPRDRIPSDLGVSARHDSTIWRRILVRHQGPSAGGAPILADRRHLHFPQADTAIHADPTVSRERSQIQPHHLHMGRNAMQQGGGKGEQRW